MRRVVTASDDPKWTAVDEYIADRLVPKNDALAAVLAANRAAGLPAIDVSPLQGRLLQVLVRAVSARRVLEIGTLGGYSTVCLARALPPDGRVVTLEIDPKHAAAATANFRRAGVAEMVELIVGPARQSLERLVDGGRGPFDLIFIDADKPSNPEYLAWALRLSRVGTLIVVDNVVRDGAVADAADADPKVVGSRQALEMLGADQRLCATAMQTVGCKGYDGFALAVVMEDVKR
jgi:predicted O-methyltransferase YrrM